MTRFFVESQVMQPGIFPLDRENAAHARVLRLKRGDQVVLSDGHTSECICTITDITPEQVYLTIESWGDMKSEPMLDVTLYVAFPKLDKLEHVIQKATELGARTIVAFPSSRCVSRPDEKSLAKKLDRWQKIARSAAEQSGRGLLPHVEAESSFEAAVERAAQAEMPILLYENEHATTLRMALEDGYYTSVALMSGPEGGLTEEEVALAREKGMRICTLGSRILRCETAPLCALSAVMYHIGEF